MSVYAQPGSSSGSAYAQQGSSSGSVYAGGSGGTPPKKKGGHGLLGKIGKYSGADLVGNLAKDVGEAAVGFGPGIYKAGESLGTDIVKGSEHPTRGADYNPATGRKSKFKKDIVAPTIKQYKDYYGHDVLHHIYEHPLQPILDAATVASLGGSAGAKLGLLSDERALLETRSPRAIQSGKGPVHVDLGSTAPLAKGRELVAQKLRTVEGVKIPGTQATRVGGGEVKRYGKQIQAEANQHALAHVSDYQPYLKATRHLSQREWAALHIRAMDIHPADLKQLWKGSEAERFANDPKVQRLVEQPSKKLVLAEQEARRLSTAGEKLLRDRRMLKDETAAARPSLTKKQASERLGRSTTDIHGDPYYLPHMLEEKARPVTPLGASGGGKGIARAPGSTRQNLGVLALTGKMHLRSDVLGPEFLRRVKYVKYDEIHNALLRGSVRVTKAELDQSYGGKLPNGYEYVRAKTTGRVPPTMRGESETARPLDQLIPKAATRETRGPATGPRETPRPAPQKTAPAPQASGPRVFRFKDEAHARRSIEIQETHLSHGNFQPGDKSVPLAKAELAAAKRYLQTGKNPEAVTRADTSRPLSDLIPNAEDLHDSQLARDGFSTTEQAHAHSSGGKFYIAPRATIKAATGEFTRSSEFTHRFVRQPLSVWRAAVLGLRPGFFTNNLVGNSIMYAAKTGGNGALRDLFGSIRESHGPEVAKKALDSPGTPPALRKSLYEEFFPEQTHGTFGRTQSPSASALGQAGSKGKAAYRGVTGAIPKVTSAVAEAGFRKALVRHYIRNSPEFKSVYQGMPRQTRTFETAARRILEGKTDVNKAAYQRLVSKQVNQALGDYLNLSPTERNVFRNVLPFYAWYRAIVTTTAHLAVDTPLRANILGQIGQIGKQWSDQQLGDIPSFLEGAIPLGKQKNGLQKVLATQGLNPYATLEQLRSGSTGDITSLGLNPFLEGALDAYAQAKQRGGEIGPAGVAKNTLGAMLAGLPLSQVIAPAPPSKLYPKRNRRSTGEGYFGVPIKTYDVAQAALQKKAGR